MYYENEIAKCAILTTLIGLIIINFFSSFFFFFWMVNYWGRGGMIVQAIPPPPHPEILGGIYPPIPPGIDTHARHYFSWFP